MCGVFDALVLGSTIEDEYVDILGVHARFIRTHLEHDVGGNHLVKNLKALIGLGIFLGDQRLVSNAGRALSKQLEVQVLPDGGHYERSPSYHCQVLGDFLDIARLLEDAGEEEVVGLAKAIESMRRWLGTMLMPDGDVPLLNDCWLVGVDHVRALTPRAPSTALAVLQPSGYVVARIGRLQLVADVGLPCPPHLPAHAHADCLSFELAVDGERLVVDTGTSTYAPGARRAFERSTAAHNTLELDGEDQTEVWAVFRAARLAAGRLEQVARSGNKVGFTGSHNGYRRLPGRPTHRRTWQLGDDCLTVIDEISGRGRHRVSVRFYIAPGVHVRQDDTGITAGRLKVSVQGATVDVGPSLVAVGFGQSARGHVITASTEGELPIQIQTTIVVTTTENAPPDDGCSHAGARCHPLG